MPNANVAKRAVVYRGRCLRDATANAVASARWRSSRQHRWSAYDSSLYDLSPMRWVYRRGTGRHTIKGGEMAPHAYTPTSVCRVLIGLAVLGGLIGLPALGRCADDGDFARATLRGLQGVYVLIGLLPISLREFQ